MALGLLFFGYTNYEICYRVTNDGDGGSINLDAAGGASPDLVTDTPAGTPIGQLVRQPCPTEDIALQMMCDLDLNGEVTVRPPVAHLGDVKLQPETGLTLWEVRVLDDGAGHLRLTIDGGTNEDANPTAILKIKYRHSIDR